MGKSLAQLLDELEADFEPTGSWTLDTALEHVREIQLATQDFGYHLALGGGVLNKGYSLKDVDLFFLPLDNSKTTTDPKGMLDFLTNHYGTFPVDINSSEAYGPSELYAHKVKFNFNGRRVDAFIT